MEITERISTGGASEDDIRSLERRIGVDLPVDYRTFLAKENGGRPRPTAFEGPNGDGSVVHFFFTLDPNASHYRLHEKIDTYAGRIPEGLLPIACDDFGNLVLLDVGAKSVGAIYFWDHEEENMDGDPFWDNISFISASFAEFVESLH
ncbi:SMI1/KNR4 family protein [Singulisphaera acidiphila]|uniref:Putative glucan synthasis protein n=1 Tax=Singulisphaera acidiphila (strain ATCC BAA-1392 / DSM 18658 / VKM B-2454 / MOB10) TaxID=886293 RepID=L0DJE0_SINAD|nr:SMI1/KNR4 family protein [Singulisphaera acidiphila]AGA28933.1 putative glucan synthasis protein [Singulisphaera acidiphila DSM 18658]